MKINQTNFYEYLITIRNNLELIGDNLEMKNKDLLYKYIDELTELLALIEPESQKK